MKHKILISFLFITLFFSIFFTSNVFADSSLVSQVLNEMDTAKVGVTLDNDLTKIIRTIYAFIQVTVVGVSLVYFTWHSTRFFSNDKQVRARAKENLPYRVGALLLILAIDGLISIIVKYLAP